MSTTPVMSHVVSLHVTEPVTMILGGGDILVEEGDTMNLTCLVKVSTEHQTDGEMTWWCVLRTVRSPLSSYSGSTMTRKYLTTLPGAASVRSQRKVDTESANLTFRCSVTHLKQKSSTQIST